MKDLASAVEVDIVSIWSMCTLELNPSGSITFVQRGRRLQFTDGPHSNTHRFIFAPSFMDI